MSRRPVWSARRLLAGGALVLAWCVLWGDVSAANLLSGLLVVLLLGRLQVGPAVAGPVRLVPLVQFAWFVLVDLVVSTGAVAREILTPTDSTEEAIIAVVVPASARRHLLLLLIAITVTPGTAVVDTDGRRLVLELHPAEYPGSRWRRATAMRLAWQHGRRHRPLRAPVGSGFHP